MNSGDIAWMLISTALVVFMVPGLALFYGGMDRSKNVLNMLNMNLYCIGVVPLLWVTLSWTLGNSANGEEESGFWGGDLIGNWNQIGLDGLNMKPDDLIFVAFLMTFASITPALISGAVADRMKFSAWIIFVPIWSLLVYTPVTYWVYKGWHEGMGAIDFAGGTAIHINAGAAALALVLVLGKRNGWPTESSPPHNLPLVMLGTGILWFGWFGFNAGSAGAANGQAVQALLNTFVAAAAGMIGWMLIEWYRDGKATTLGACSGVVAALVAITPAAGYVGGLSSIIFGLVAGTGCYFLIGLKNKIGYDDSLDVVGVHGGGGVIGGLLLGLFADNSAINSEPGGFQDGLFFGGGGELFIDQVLAIVSVIIFSFVLTFIIAKAIDATIGLRVSEEDENAGLDQSQHAETAYNL
ncbi:MAG: ammonia channel protein [Acidimicrobiaceae bacterium]|jgi:Amt family ammonium transporter|nr:ammonia channel protein [Acidimicrobiaceae bacterium]|tara:strand:- start:24657 stop:25886 length:1230 start_codon:yes stop_codon:yes gene_type:complete